MLQLFSINANFANYRRIFVLIDIFLVKPVSILFQPNKTVCSQAHALSFLNSKPNMFQPRRSTVPVVYSVDW